MNLAPCLSGAFSHQLDPTQAPPHLAAVSPSTPSGHWENPHHCHPWARAFCLLPCLLPSVGCRCPSEAGLGEVIQKSLSVRVCCGFRRTSSQWRRDNPLAPHPSDVFRWGASSASPGAAPRARCRTRGCTRELCAVPVTTKLLAGCSAAAPIMPGQSWHCAMGIVAQFHPSKEFKGIDAAN